MQPYRFRLYVAGKTELTRTVLAGLRSLCESRLQGGYELDVIDVLERPDLAEVEGILIAPTVVRLSPLPQHRVYGDLSDRDRAVSALGLPDPAEPMAVPRVEPAEGSGGS
jgi:circadian clock protein KaiB